MAYKFIQLWDVVIAGVRRVPYADFSAANQHKVREEKIHATPSTVVEPVVALQTSDGRLWRLLGNGVIDLDGSRMAEDERLLKEITAALSTDGKRVLGLLYTEAYIPPKKKEEYHGD